MAFSILLYAVFHTPATRYKKAIDGQVITDVLGGKRVLSRQLHELHPRSTLYTAENAGFE
jgi:hypothetical protein